MDSNLDIINNIKNSWDAYHGIDSLELIYPETIPIILLKGILNKKNNLNKLIDFGCGSGQHHGCVENNIEEIIGIDYSPNALQRCGKKSKKFLGYNIDLYFEEEYRKILNKNNCDGSIITCFQILDHIKKKYAYKLLEHIAQSSASFIILSLFTDECYGPGIKGKYNSEIDAYIAPISYSLKDKIEMHTFFSFNEIEDIKKIFKNYNYKLIRSMRSSISKYSSDSNFKDFIKCDDYMDTVYFSFLKC